MVFQDLSDIEDRFKAVDWTLLSFVSGFPSSQDITGTYKQLGDKVVTPAGAYGTLYRHPTSRRDQTCQRKRFLPSLLCIDIYVVKYLPSFAGIHFS